MSLPTERVKRSLEQVIEWRGKPKKFAAIIDYLQNQIFHNKSLFSQPGNPQQNAYVERFNRAVRWA